jgi:hypothetical protein
MLYNRSSGVLFLPEHFLRVRCALRGGVGTHFVTVWSWWMSQPTGLGAMVVRLLLEGDVGRWDGMA